MAKLTKYGTSISVSADLTEILREYKAQNEPYKYISMARMVQILIAERLNEIQGKKRDVNYVELLGLLRR